MQQLRLKLSCIDWQHTFVLLAFVMTHLMIAVEDLSLQFIILLMERRTHFRAACVRVNRVGATLVTLFCAMMDHNHFPPVFARIRFWGPWVGDLYLTEE